VYRRWEPGSGDALAHAQCGSVGYSVHKTTKRGGSVVCACAVQTLVSIFIYGIMTPKPEKKMKKVLSEVAKPKKERKSLQRNRHLSCHASICFDSANNFREQGKNQNNC
jgi:hypothetical protein